MYNFGRLDFPNQHVSYAEKQEVDWYAKCCDYVIEAGIAQKQPVRSGDPSESTGGIFQTASGDGTEAEGFDQIF